MRGEGEGRRGARLGQVRGRGEREMERNMGRGERQKGGGEGMRLVGLDKLYF